MAVSSQFDDRTPVSLSANLKLQQDPTLPITGKGGKVGYVPVRCCIDTTIEVDYYRDGGILPRV
jgi:aconitate hydratase